MAMPEHPKGSTVRTDELGSYIAFHRLCNACAIELTSRNRPTDGSLRCRECTATKAREVWAMTHDATAVWATRLKKPPGGPERQAIHHLLTAFLNHPTIKDHKDKLLAALVTHELKERFRTL